MKAIQELVKLIPPPLEPLYATPPDTWKASGPCPKLPLELLEYATVYGSGSFQGDATTRLWIYNPFSPHYPALIREECDRLKEEFEFGGYDAVPFPIFPAVDGVYPLGSDDCGTRMWWWTKNDIKCSPIIVQWSSGEDGYKLFQQAFISFLVSLFRREILPDYWQAPWFVDNVRFVPEDESGLSTP
jgi:hypothetical protein